MSLTSWADNGWLRPHKTDKEEISNLLNIVERDINDANQVVVSSDWRFGIAYNAALKLCTILLYVEGYRPEKTLAHYRTLQALPLIMGKSKDDDADYLESCRTKRNIAEYDYVGGTTESEANELIKFVLELKNDVINWLRETHTDLL